MLSNTNRITVGDFFFPSSITFYSNTGTTLYYYSFLWGFTCLDRWSNIISFITPLVWSSKSTRNIVLCSLSQIGNSFVYDLTTTVVFVLNIWIEASIINTIFNIHFKNHSTAIIKYISTTEVYHVFFFWNSVSVYLIFINNIRIKGIPNNLHECMVFPAI